MLALWGILRSRVLGWTTLRMAAQQQRASVRHRQFRMEASARAAIREPSQRHRQLIMPIRDISELCRATSG